MSKNWHRGSVNFRQIKDTTKSSKFWELDIKKDIPAPNVHKKIPKFQSKSIYKDMLR